MIASQSGAFSRWCLHVHSLYVGFIFVFRIPLTDQKHAFKVRGNSKLFQIRPNIESVLIIRVDFQMFIQSSNLKIR